MKITKLNGYDVYNWTDIPLDEREAFSNYMKGATQPSFDHVYIHDYAKWRTMVDSGFIWDGNLWKNPVVDIGQLGSKISDISYGNVQKNVNVSEELDEFPEMINGKNAKTMEQILKAIVRGEIVKNFSNHLPVNVTIKYGENDKLKSVKVNGSSDNDKRITKKIFDAMTQIQTELAHRCLQMSEIKYNPYNEYNSSDHLDTITFVLDVL